jgi:hypothetical protein
MELITNDLQSASVKFTRDEFASIAKILLEVYQEYASLDEQIIEVPKEYIERLTNDFHALVERMIDNTNRALEAK